MSESAKKEFRELQRLIRQKGYKVVPGRGGHVKILDSKGRKVIDENGPLILSSSPGDFRARDLAAARLIRAGVLERKDLPWQPEKPKGLLLGDAADNGKKSKAEQARDRREEERRKVADENRSRHERTQEVRARLEPIITRLGGWGKRGLVGELGSVVFHHSKGAPWGFPSVQAARANATSLRKGGTLSDDRLTCWLGLLDTLEGAPLLREAWFDMVRAARGLPPRSQPVVAEMPGSVVEGGLNAPPARVLLTPETGALAAELERQYSTPRWGRAYPDEPNPLLQLQADGGLRWLCEFTNDDLLELGRALGFFEGLAVQLSVFEGQELVEPALARLRQLFEHITEARFRALAGKEAGAVRSPEPAKEAQP
jgi:hypothetical protein